MSAVDVRYMRADIEVDSLAICFYFSVGLMPQAITIPYHFYGKSLRM